MNFSKKFDNARVYQRLPQALLDLMFRFYAKICKLNPLTCKTYSERQCRVWSGHWKIKRSISMSFFLQFLDFNTLFRFSIFSRWSSVCFFIATTYFFYWLELKEGRYIVFIRALVSQLLGLSISIINSCNSQRERYITHWSYWLI